MLKAPKLLNTYGRTKMAAGQLLTFENSHHNSSDPYLLHKPWTSVLLHSSFQDLTLKAVASAGNIYQLFVFGMAVSGAVLMLHSIELLMRFVVNIKVKSKSKSVSTSCFQGTANTASSDDKVRR